MIRTSILLVVTACGLAACAAEGGPDCGGEAPVLGTWDYHAVQTSPAPGSTLDGTLSIPEVSACDFSGSLNVDETINGSGDMVTRTGPVFGVAASAMSVTFDAEFDDGTDRIHGARLIGDSLAGDWVDGGGGSSPRGTFWARRTGP